MRKFTMMCPNCHSTHHVQKITTHAKRVQPLVLLLKVQQAGAAIGLVAGPVGAVAGGIAGGLLGALTGATAGL